MPIDEELAKNALKHNCMTLCRYVAYKKCNKGEHERKNLMIDLTHNLNVILWSEFIAL